MKKLLIIVIAILATICIGINIDKNIEAFWSVESASVLSIILCIFLYQILLKSQKLENKRLKICAIIVACLFATIEIIGYSINTYLDLSSTIGTGRIIIKNLLKWFGYATFFYGVIVLIFHFLDNTLQKVKKEETSFSFFTDNKKSFFICMAVIFLAWLPYLLRYFPGNATSDSVSQMLQALGITKLNNHHPIAHTGVIFIGMCIGRILENYNIGIAVYSVIQMLLMSAIFSYAIYYMAKKKIPLVFRVVALLFFACYPINALYSITMWKDVIFSGLVLLVVISIVEIITNQEEFFQRKSNKICFTVILILMLVFRSNGVYVAILTMPFLIIVAKKYYKQLLIMFFVVLAVYGIFKGPFFAIFDIKGAPTREALSIPLQQFARMLKVREDMSEEDKEAIYHFLPIENEQNLYIPTLSDPIKAKFNEKYFKDHKLEFIGLWVKLVVKYPVEAIESFLCNSYGYWYPETKNWVVAREIYQGKIDGDKDVPITIYQKPFIKGEMVTKMDSLIEKRNIPVVSMLFSIGFAFWIMIVVFVYFIYQKRYKILVSFIPIWVLWLTCIASPVYCEYRYIYSLFICLPILIATLPIREKKTIGGK